MTEFYFNADNWDEKNIVLTAVRQLKGPQRIKITKQRKGRTLPQNRWYWSCIVQPFGDFLREQGESYTDEDAHELMKAKFLRITIFNKRTGEVIGESVKSTTKLTTDEFSEYVEKCIAWLAEMFGIICAFPHERTEAA